MNYSREVERAAQAIAAGKQRSADELNRNAYAERCARRETKFGAILDRLPTAELDALAERKFVFAHALKVWKKSGRPLTGRYREDLLRQLEVERRDDSTGAEQPCLTFTEES